MQDRDNLGWPSADGIKASIDFALDAKAKEWEKFMKQTNEETLFGHAVSDSDEHGYAHVESTNKTAGVYYIKADRPIKYGDPVWMDDKGRIKPIRREEYMASTIVGHYGNLINDSSKNQAQEPAREEKSKQELIDELIFMDSEIEILKYNIDNLLLSNDEIGKRKIELSDRAHNAERKLSTAVWQIEHLKTALKCLTDALK